MYELVSCVCLLVCVCWVNNHVCGCPQVCWGGLVWKFGGRRWCVGLSIGEFVVNLCSRVSWWCVCMELCVCLYCEWVGTCFVCIV